MIQSLLKALPLPLSIAALAIALSPPTNIVRSFGNDPRWTIQILNNDIQHEHLLHHGGWLKDHGDDINELLVRVRRLEGR